MLLPAVFIPVTSFISNRPVPGQRSEVTGHSSRFCHRLVLQTVLFFFSRFEGEYETSRAEQLVPGTDPDRRPLFVHQSVLRPHRCNPATGGSAALSLPWLNASKQTQPTPQHRLVMGGSWGGGSDPVMLVWGGSVSQTPPTHTDLVNCVYNRGAGSLCVLQEISTWTRDRTCP